MTRFLLIEPLHILLSPGPVYEIDPLNPHMRKDLTFAPAPEVGTVSSLFRVLGLIPRRCVKAPLLLRMSHFCEMI
jgi:hypothetical protein